MHALLIAIVAGLLAAVAALTLAFMDTRAQPPIRFVEDAARPVPATAHVSASPEGSWLPRALAQPRVGPCELFAFYMSWDDASRRALQDHAGQIGWLIPGVSTIAGPGQRLRYEPDTHLRSTVASTARKPRLMPMVQNTFADGRWDGSGTALLLADPQARQRFANTLLDMVATEGGQGVMLDLESLPRTAHGDYRRLLHELHVRFSPRGWIVALAASFGDDWWDLTAYAGVADRVVLMAYDEHWMGGEAGPIASQPWFARVVTKAVNAVGRDKAIGAIDNYAYDWSDGRSEPLTVVEAWARAARVGTSPVYNPASGTAHFGYSENGREHQVWLLDAVSAANQLRVLDRLGVNRTALWRLGSEDPGFWAALRGDAAGLRKLPASPGVVARGSGEVMRLDAEAAAGVRHVRTSSDGLIRDARYARLPTADTIQSTGVRDRMVALTFDDGLDAPGHRKFWTCSTVSMRRPRSSSRAPMFSAKARCCDESWLKAAN